MAFQNIQLEFTPSGVGLLMLNRPQAHNAFDDRTVGEISEALEKVDATPACRVLIIGAHGSNFSAGADLNWMLRSGKMGEEENERDARQAADMLLRLDQLPKPTIARVHGAALGGGAGLVACCDIAIAADDAVFGFSEVRLGLAPAIISPYVVRAIGVRQARRYFLTGERFPAQEAARLGLAHVVVPANALEGTVRQVTKQLLEGGPRAQAESKALADYAGSHRAGEEAADHTSKLIARLRSSEEAQEGLAAFLEKRKPVWKKPE